MPIVLNHFDLKLIIKLCSLNNELISNQEF